MFTLALRVICACGDFLSRIYPERRHLQSPPKPPSQLTTPSASQVPSDDDTTSGIASDPEHDASSWTTRRQQYGILSSPCDAHCVFVNGPHSARLNKKVCKRQGVKLATLLISGELYSIGSLAGPTPSGWVASQMCTFHRDPYVRDRDSRRCRADACFHGAVNLTLVGTFAKRCQLQIEEALMDISSGRKPPHGRIRPLTTEGGTGASPEVTRRPPLHTSRRPSQSSLDSGFLSAMPSARNSFGAIGRLHHDQARVGVYPPSKWGEEVLRDDPKTVHSVTPDVASSSENKTSSAVGLDRSLYPSPSIGPLAEIPSMPGSGHGMFSSATTGRVGLKRLTPAIVRRPRGGIHPGKYPFETLSICRPSIQSDPVE